MSAHYDRAFYANLSAGVRRSAEIVVPILLEALAPRSVVDLGCGTGTWLSVFRAHGVQDVLGLDGDYVDRSALEIPAECFRAADLNQPVRLERRFDLAISLEVGEHLRPERSAGFVADLTALAPAVCFGAAIPLQGGRDHINERWQDEWAALFAAHGRRPVDLLRKRLWDDPEVYPWYAQNTLLYVDESIALTGDELPMRLVHPRRYVERLSEPSRLHPARVSRKLRFTARQLSAGLAARRRSGGGGGGPGGGGGGGKDGGSLRG